MTSHERITTSDPIVTRRQWRRLSPLHTEIGKTPYSFIQTYLDDLIETRNFELAKQTGEYLFKQHEGSYSRQLFSVAMQHIALPYHEWMADESAEPSNEKRTEAYVTSTNLAILAHEYYERSIFSGDNSTATTAIGVASETLFDAVANRLMASSSHLPLVILPAPQWMDYSNSGDKKDGIDFLAYYHDLCVPIQVKTRPLGGGANRKDYKDEILVVAIDQLANQATTGREALLASLQEETRTKALSSAAQTAQDRLFHYIDQHAETHRDTLHTTWAQIYSKKYR